MTLCPKCKAMILTTPNGEICQNCGWGSIRTWKSDNAVNLPLIIPEESPKQSSDDTMDLPLIMQEFLKTRLLETDINDLTIRLSALEADLERLKKTTRARDENLLDQIHAQQDSLRFVYVIRERTEYGWDIVDNVCYPTFENARGAMKKLIKDAKQSKPDYNANNLNIIQVKVRE